MGLKHVRADMQTEFEFEFEMCLLQVYSALQFKQKKEIS